MGAIGARHYYTVIFTLFCMSAFTIGATTQAHAWATDFVRATDQPDYPGITKHFINRVAKDGGVITMYYPETGNAVIDKTVLAVITKQLTRFEDVTDDAAPDSSREERAISSNYVIHRPSLTSLSVEYTLCEESGKAFCYKHNLNFSLVDGRLLALEDMFEDPKLALKLMSDWSRRTLPQKVQVLWNREEVNKATTPTTENFHNQLIIPKGLRLVFDIGTVGPMAIGDPELDMPLKELAKAGPKPEVWGKIEGVRPADQGTQKKSTEAPAPNSRTHPAPLSTPLQTPVFDKMQLSAEHATFLVADIGANGMNVPCIDSGVPIERCIYIAPDFMAHFEDAASDFAFVQGQVAHGAAAQATYIWGLYRTASGFRSTPPVFVCEKCTPGKVFIKKDVIMLSQIKRSPFDAQTVSLKFRIADGTLKKIN